QRRALTRGKQEKPRAAGFAGVRHLLSAAAGLFAVPEIRLIRHPASAESRGTAALKLLIDKV
ncbi:MAG TPA: hypothetical protein VJN94_05025, partial [Candidatus Binataceae bacterium]|nr:hypothetical protein [Candidatus Binataceae bacterium]